MNPAEDNSAFLMNSLRFPPASIVAYLEVDGVQCGKYTIEAIIIEKGSRGKGQKSEVRRKSQEEKWGTRKNAAYGRRQRAVGAIRASRI